VGFDVLLVVRRLNPFALFIHSVSLRRRVWVLLDKTRAQAPIFPLFRWLGNSESSARA
jgi:hypothetical protein